MRAVLAQLGAEVRAALRMPAMVIPLFGFPPLFFLMFAAQHLTTPQAANQTTAGFLIFAFMGVVFFQFAVNAAEEREIPWFTYLRTLPVAPWTRPAALILASLVLGTAAAAVLFAVADLTTPLSVPPARYPAVLAVLVAGAVPMALLGQVLGTLFRIRAVTAVANLVYLPAAYLGGLWMPVEFLPEWAQKVSPYLPTRHWVELLWAVVLERPWPASSPAVLAGYSAAFALLLWVLRRR